MSVLSAIKTFFTVAPADVDKAAKAIYAKADADVAALKKSSAASQAHAGREKSLAAAKAVYEEHVKLLNTPSTAPAAPTGTTGPSA